MMGRKIIGRKIYEEEGFEISYFQRFELR